MWRVEQLLCNDREMGGYTRSVSGQRLGKHVPVAMQQILNNATIGLQQWKSLFSAWSVPRCYKQGTRLEIGQLWDIRRTVTTSQKLENFLC
jgi:hypothetical protein